MTGSSRIRCGITTKGRNALRRSDEILAEVFSALSAEELRTLHRLTVQALGHPRRNVRIDQSRQARQRGPWRRVTTEAQFVTDRAKARTQQVACAWPPRFRR